MCFTMFLKEETTFKCVRGYSLTKKAFLDYENYENIRKFDIFGIFGQKFKIYFYNFLAKTAKKMCLTMF